MVSLMQRRREMMQRAAAPAPTPTLIFELPSATSTASYDTGVKLFDPAISFTILCDATFANRSWTSTQTLFGLGTGFEFALGSRSGSDYYEGIFQGTSRRYTALIMNNIESDDDKKKLTSLFARFSNTSEQTHRIAVRYNASSFKAEGFSDYSGGETRHAPNNYWFNLNSNYSSTATLKLLISSGGTINIFKVYSGLLTDTEINNFLDQITN